MTTFEKIFLYLVLGFIPPIALLLAAWWGSLPFTSEENIKWFVLAGFLAGLVLDIVYLRKWVNYAYRIRWWNLLLVVSFYQIGMFGFFMGVPIFHLAIPLAAGYYLGKRTLSNNLLQKESRRWVRITALISAIFMMFISAASGWFALNDPFTASGLQHMLGLGFLPTSSQLFGLVLIGGLVLVIAAYYLTYLGHRAAGNRVART